MIKIVRSSAITSFLRNAWMGVAVLYLGRVTCHADTNELSVVDWLPSGYVDDGSEMYLEPIQRAIDAAAQTGRPLRFPPMTYAVDERGWKLLSNSTLILTGATFRFAEGCQKDGALFSGVAVNHVKIVGGLVIGRNDRWKDGVNIRGIHLAGPSQDIEIRETRFRDLSSNAIGIFGTPENHIVDVRVVEIAAHHCCKRYPEYLSKEKGEPGSVREDQGDVAFYYVEDFRVAGCRLENSRSDETHFYRCRQGQISDNCINRAKMGGFFLEQCEYVIGRGNLILDNGSRGATIERGCLHCVFSDNIVRGSGREGLWAPDCTGLSVTGNLFERNGRKPNGPEPRYLWNANITINEAYKEPTNSPTRDYLISDNILQTSNEQIAAIRIDAVDQTQNIVVRGNLLVGENRTISIEGPMQSEIFVEANVGANIESKP